MSIDRSFDSDPNRFKRVRYFNGLFLEDVDFRLDQDYFNAFRRYLNYLLFEPGRLYVDDAVTPLEVSASGSTLTITPGSAMVRDVAVRQGYEVEVPAGLAPAQYQFDLSGETLTAGEQLFVIAAYQVRDATESTGGIAGAPSAANRTYDGTLISVVLPGEAPPATAHAVLAQVDVTGGGLSVTNFPRGGVRLPILSDQVRSQLGSGGAPATLTTVVITTAGPVNLTVPATLGLSVEGSFSDGSSRPLTVGDGLTWSSSDPAVASVSPSGLVSALAAGSATIRATAGALFDEVAVAVSAGLEVTGFTPGLVLPTQPDFEVRGRNIIRSGLTTVGAPAAGTIVRFVDTADATTVLATMNGPLIASATSDPQRIRMTVPAAGDIALPAGNHDVHVQVELDGALHTLTTQELRVRIL